jgi:uncharacterized protein (UPF0333 family)
MLIRDEKAQISAEMILLVGAIMIIVCLVGFYVYHISKSIGDSISGVVTNARDTTIGKM